MRVFHCTLCREQSRRVPWRLSCFSALTNQTALAPPTCQKVCGELATSRERLDSAEHRIVELEVGAGRAGELLQ